MLSPHSRTGQNMPAPKTTTALHLFKQNFKFSAAHFLIFDAQSAEKLHGHNYQVKVDIDFGAKPVDETGFLVDFNVLKKIIHARLQEWDEMVLLPALHPEMKIAKTGATLEVKFRDRFYAFPANEVLLLPMTNTSVELLSAQLATEFFNQFKTYGVQKLRVFVEETLGQGASYQLES